ncbi:MAG: cation transporter [Verrucomicrobiae bacterium]|nr:cation transporter [Verrucomicrobiae bacterium]MCP5539473.1 cation transporter [Akkermansiaceae bacterium]MCP5551707.1 cation transporter [Akkermansiaceae bacterium]
MTAGGGEGGQRARLPLRRATWWSFAVGLLMLGIKTGAWWVTQSSAILSDAAESVVHVAAVAFVVFSIHLAQKPPDSDHPYGHAKISFFSAGFEGGLISLAGVFIMVQAAKQWIAGALPHHLGPGTLLTAVAMAINAALGLYLIRFGKRCGSLILVANGQHVLTDAWTSIGVLAGLALTWATGWAGFDPLCAILVALNILWSGIRLMWRSAGGLMDRADPAIQEALTTRLDRATAARGITWHQMRHRHLGDGLWVDLHLVFDDRVTVRDAHEVATEIEREIRDELGPNTFVTTHLEPREDHERIHGHPPGAGDLAPPEAEVGHPGTEPD